MCWMMLSPFCLQFLQLAWTRMSSGNGFRCVSLHTWSHATIWVAKLHPVSEIQYFPNVYIAYAAQSIVDVFPNLEKYTECTEQTSKALLELRTDRLNGAKLQRTTILFPRAPTQVSRQRSRDNSCKSRNPSRSFHNELRPNLHLLQRIDSRVLKPTPREVFAHRYQSMPMVPEQQLDTFRTVRVVLRQNQP